MDMGGGPRCVAGGLVLRSASMKIVFTSCMDAERVADQAIWGRIAQEQPDVLMLLGDQIYMDWGVGLETEGWRALIAAQLKKGLECYARDMHRRYALQWGVKAFRELICGFSGRADPSRLLLTWDDHDFAWNDSLGVDGEGPAYRRGVPAHVKAVSRSLFMQFTSQLRHAAVNDPYPGDLPPDWSAPAPEEHADLFWSGPLAGPGGPPCLLLDTRWHREARATSASLLGPVQAAALKDAVADSGAGLLIVAAGSPMAHRYMLWPDGWHDDRPGGYSYVEYDATLRAARRPVLFLGGDVHCNVWGGRLPSTDGALSRVVQVLSSGAAIGRIGPRRFAPSYGCVTLPATWSSGGVVDVKLWAQSADGAWQPDPPMPPLPFNANDWTQPLQGKAYSRVDAAADDQPLALFMARTRTSGFSDRTDVHLSQGMDDLDGVYQKFPLEEDRCAEPLYWCAHKDGSARMVCQADIDRPGDWPAATYQLMQAAFERALERAGTTSVVLFIHGFGKSPAMSVAQAYGLRASYPACEPILYGWEAGRAGGVLAALSGVPSARQGAQGGSFALATVLHAFNQVASLPVYDRLAKVVLARSAGCLALHHALQRMGADVDRLAHVDRIVLSAPLLLAAEYEHKTGLGGMKRPVVLTRNLHDETLRLAQPFCGVGKVLGVEDGFVPARPNHLCLDFTGSPGVGSLHDYLFLDINPRQHALHAQLLSRANAEPSWLDAAVAAGWIQPGKAGVFDVA